MTQRPVHPFLHKGFANNLGHSVSYDIQTVPVGAIESITTDEKCPQNIKANRLVLTFHTCLRKITNPIPLFLHTLLGKLLQATRSLFTQPSCHLIKANAGVFYRRPVLQSDQQSVFHMSVVSPNLGQKTLFYNH